MPAFSIARLSAGEEQEGRDGHPPDHPGGVIWTSSASRWVQQYYTSFYCCCQCFELKFY
nr:MAG TPA: hypothetical protein [Caudoviricetes sp.]